MAEIAASLRRLAFRDIAIAERLPKACVNLRGDARDPAFRRAVAAVVDFEPPLTPNTSCLGLFAAALWLGPNEWLIVSDTQPGSELTARLRQALAAARAAVTDVSAGRVVFELTGSNALALLARGCSIDLDPSVFKHGCCAQTLLAKIPVLIHARASGPLIDVYVARSFSGYASRWFETAALDYRQDDR